MSSLSFFILYHIITNRESPPLPKNGRRGNQIYVRYDSWFMNSSHSYHIISNTELPPSPKHGCQGNKIYVRYHYFFMSYVRLYFCAACETWQTHTQVGIRGTTANSRKRKFVLSSHPGPFAVVASSRKRQTKVGSLACFDSL